MVLLVLRAIFVLIMASVGWFFLTRPIQPFGDYTWLSMTLMLSLGVLTVCIDILAPRRKLALLSGTFLGLVVGLAIAWAASFVVVLVVDQLIFTLGLVVPASQRDMILVCMNLAVGAISCYLAISFIMQTKDDFRFIIPYVEFSKQTKGARPILLDTSVLIDGRIGDIATTGVFESQLIVPRFVQRELQHIADSSDKLMRAKGRRGLDILSKLKQSDKPEVIDYDSSGRDHPELSEVDQKLIALARDLNARVLTNDSSLAKVARVQGVDVISVHDLASALRISILPGERMSVQLIKAGEDAGQGVGYLDDGTMVVVEHGRNHIGEEVEFTVTNVRQTQVGKMIFGRLGAENGTNAPHARRSSRPRSDAPAGS
jgi:uncharacterized protein YacL